MLLYSVLRRGIVSRSNDSEIVGLSFVFFGGWMTVTLTDRSPSMLSDPQMVHGALRGGATITLFCYLQAFSPASHSVNTLQSPCPVARNATSTTKKGTTFMVQIRVNWYNLNP